MKVEKNKTTVAVVFGGKSVEHDISIITGVQTLNALKGSGMECNIIPIYISKEGKWLTSDDFFNINCFSHNDVQRNPSQISVAPNDAGVYLMKNNKQKKIATLDFVYFATHGGQGENGSLQGFFDACGIAYSSSNVYSSAVCMNKLATKYVLMQNNINTTKFVHVCGVDFLQGFDVFYEKLKIGELKFPVIVKPCNLGSSIGITFCRDKEKLNDALSFAFLFDSDVLIEEAVENLREVNVAIIGNSRRCEYSDIEEVSVEKDFLTFENKYMQDGLSKGMEGAKRIIPAALDIGVKNQIEDMAVRAYKILGCKGIVRVDFLINGETGEVFLNELNTIPGSLSNYLWKSKNYKFGDILRLLKDYAIEDKKMGDGKILNFSTSVLKKFDGKGKTNFGK